MSKMKFYNDAEKMFLYENLPPEEIAKKLKISRRTVYYWRNKNKWDNKKAEIMRNKKALSNDLLTFLKTLIQKLTKDMADKTTINQSELYSLINLLKEIPELHKYEKLINQAKAKEPTGQLSPEFVQQVQKEILGM